MARFRIVGTRSDGPETHVAGITALIAHDAGGGARIYSASGHQGGILVRDPARDLEIVQQRGFAPASAAAGITTPGLAVIGLAGREALASFGQAPGGRVNWLDGAGQLAGGFDLPAAMGTLTGMAVLSLGGGRDLILTTTLQDTGITSWLRDPGGTLRRHDQITAGATGTGHDMGAMTLVQQGGQTHLFAVSASGNMLTRHVIGADGRASLADTLGPADGLAIATPRLIEHLRLEGRDYLLLGSAGTGSISVIELRPDGRMRIADQINDDRDTRFAGISVLEQVTLGDRVYVVAGGADDGLSLFTLLPGGRLLYLDSIADSTATTLGNLSALSLRATGGGIEVIAAGGDAPGLTHLRVDPGPLAPIRRADPDGGTLTGDARGDLMIGGPGEDTIHGGAGNDIILDGAGRDRIHGGTGADVFVFLPDGGFDRVMDFQPGIDRIDITAWGRIYSRDQLGLIPLPQGIEIRFGEERLQLLSDHGGTITPGQIPQGHLIAPAHLGYYPIPDTGRRITGSAFDDTLLGKAGDDTLIGGGGGDHLIGQGGNDRLIGGEVDERFDETAATVYRLYRATLDRAPEQAGLIGWTGRLNGGMDLQVAANGFVNSAEFRKRFDAEANADFVTLLYANVLGRTPDPGGFANWTRALDTGTLSRAEVTLRFSQSAEFRNKTDAAALDHSREGLQADWSDDVYRLYRSTLDREPDPGGFLNWTWTLANGRDLEDVAAGFVGSVEFRTRFAAEANADFVILLYANVLGRTPDPTGLANWTNALNAGTLSRAEVALRFSQSAEFRNRTADDLTDYMRRGAEGDRLDGGPGRDVLFGGLGADTFVFRAGEAGEHRIGGLERWDRLEFDGFGYGTAGQVMAQFTQTGRDAVFADQGVRVVLADTDLSQLAPDMFLF